ncbi:MAG: DNA-binding protein WhiA [Clostridia bacterium]|nr:DNA-binding protein WhiA [Clostridia bacterium]
MNYSLALKEELIAAPPHAPCCRAAYLRGLFLNAAQTKTGKVLLKLSALCSRRECARVYRQFYRKTALIDGATMLFSSQQLLGDLLVPPNFACPECSLAFLRGALIAAGSATDPEKSYHIEFHAIEEEGRDLILRALQSHGWEGKVRACRDGGYGIYLKKNAVIEDILSVLGANQALFALMNAKITRDIRSEENRLTNCETQNIRRAVKASGRVLAAITDLRQRGLFEAMPEELRYTALLREENPDVSLPELAQKHNPTLTKSGLNHRLQKIIAFAEGTKTT